MANKIGFNFGFLSFDYELKSTVQAMLTKLFRKFASYRVLYNSFDAEYAGEVVNAVSRLRIEINITIDELSQDSGVANNLLALQGVCGDFITQAKRLSEKLKYDVELNRENIKAGVQLMDDQIELVKHYDRVGGADLMTNTSINLFQIKPIGYQILFTNELGKFRGAFGIILFLIGAKNDIVIPNELKSILPNEESSLNRN